MKIGFLTETKCAVLETSLATVNAFPAAKQRIHTASIAES
jgi:hypothetical protein